MHVEVSETVTVSRQEWERMVEALQAWRERAEERGARLYQIERIIKGRRRVTR